MDGILVVDKPQGLTSHDVVSIVKRAYKLKKVGHTGTLDPLATGVLPLCLNKATPYAGLLINSDKAYEVTLRLGQATTTYDSEGEITAEHVIPKDLAGCLNAILPQFRGEILQTPPPYSAIKVQGKPLYWWARQGKPMTVPPRVVTVFNLEILAITAETLSLRVACSKGTYVRSIGHDLGVALGCGAHVVALRRVQAGPFHVNQAIGLDEIKRASTSVEALEKWVISLSELMALTGP